ncbi:unnamed protein product, partial [Closterium sp. NIES-64]
MTFSHAVVMTSSLSVALHGGGRVLSIQSHTVQVPHSGFSQLFPFSCPSQVSLRFPSQVPIPGVSPMSLRAMWVGSNVAVFPQPGSCSCWEANGMLCLPSKAPVFPLPVLR